MKTNHIFWSLMLLAIIAFLPNLLYHPNTKLGAGPDLFALYLLIWIILSIATPFLLMLARFGLVPGNLRFLSTFLTLSSLYFGLYGLHLIISKEFVTNTPLAIGLFSLNLVWGILLFLTLQRKKTGRPYAP
jgi:hypothetical protein